MSTSVTSFGARANSAITTPVLITWNPSSSGSAAFPILNLGTAGQVLTVNSNATGPIWETPSSVTLSPNILSTATGSLVAGQPNIVSEGIFCTATLPTTCAVGQVVQIVASNGSTFKVSQGASQQILTPGGEVTTVGATGYIEALTTASAVTLMCVTANTTFVVTSNTNVLTVS